MNATKKTFAVRVVRPICWPPNTPDEVSLLGPFDTRESAEFFIYAVDAKRDNARFSVEEVEVPC